MSSNKPRLAVVLFNLGGPDGPQAVRPFLFNLFADPAIIGAPLPIRLALAAFISTTREASARKNYDLMGGASPLLPETRAQAEALEVALAARSEEFETRVFVAMRYWKPFTHETAQEVANWRPEHVVLLPLYPQFSTTTTGSSLKAWKKAYSGPGLVHSVCCYPTAEGLIKAHAARIEAAWRDAGSPDNVRLLFSAHGLPEKVIEAGDPYQRQIEATAAAVAAVAARLPQFPDWQVCYQSRVGPLKWIGPSTPEALDRAAKDGKGVVVTPIAFVSEHVETLVELDHEYGALAREKGISPYIRARALGVEPSFIETLARASLASLEGPGPAPFESTACASNCSACPAKA